MDKRVDDTARDAPSTAIGACDIARAVTDSALTAETATTRCLARIEAEEPRVGAWQYLDPDTALAQARAADDWQAAGCGTGPLQGVPIAIKDIIDTADMPTENGTIIHKGRQPSRDAACVAALRDAGAIVLGKTVTTELAVFGPGKTRNPRNLEHTPGGSSSGSAAAVAAGMVPAALGTQTAGSIIRPASFCGVHGYKPTFGTISRTGCLNQSPTLDTIGTFARCVADLARVSEVMFASDPRDADSYPRIRSPLFRMAMADFAAPPRLAFVRTPRWEAASPAAQSAIENFISQLAGLCTLVDLPGEIADAWHGQRVLQFKDIARNFAPLFVSDPSQASEKLREMMDEGATFSDAQYEAAATARGTIDAALSTHLGHFDAALTLSAPGAAPRGLAGTGDPVFNSLWTYSGWPCVSLPLLEADGLPLGLQLVAPRLRDGHLLRTAHWLESYVAA